MNKLIEKLIDKFETECHLSFDCIEREKFEQAIQTACKAQRNACLREWTNTHFDYEIGCNILTAEIKRCDYE